MALLWELFGHRRKLFVVNPQGGCYSVELGGQRLLVSLEELSMKLRVCCSPKNLGDLKTFMLSLTPFTLFHRVH